MDQSGASRNGERGRTEDRFGGREMAGCVMHKGGEEGGLRVTARTLS